MIKNSFFLGLGVLIFLGSQEQDKFYNVRYLKHELGLTTYSSTKLITQLEHRGFLITKTSSNGGVKLKMSPEKINLYDIYIGCIETFKTFDESIIKQKMNDKIDISGMKLAFKKADDEWIENIKKYTLADLIK